MRSLFALTVLLPSLASAASWNTYRKQPDDWFRSDEAQAIAANLLAWQTDRGDWPNDTDTFQPRPADARDKPGTFDDGHTTHETRFLVRMFALTGRTEYRDAALKAIDHVLASQYGSGGFPQESPPGDNYRRYITFNDRTTINLLELLRDMSREPEFEFTGEDRRRVAAKSVDAGIRGILVLQIQNKHGLTVWAAQYDESSLKPESARAFEPVSLAGAESADVLLFLMSIEEPTGEIVDAVEAGVNWFRRVQINGVRVVKENDDAHIERDLQAPPVWARFYDLDTLTPLFAGRDGVVKDSLAEIEQERRAGYAWYGDWGTKVFKAYEKWPYREQR